MKNLLKYDKKNKEEPFRQLTTEEEICERIEFKVPDGRMKRILSFLEEKGNEAMFLRGKVYSKKTLESNMPMFSMPMVLLYLPQYYHRIFLKMCMLCSRKPGNSFGRCELTTTEFYLILTEWDKIRFREVFKFLIKSRVIKVNGLGLIKLLPPYSFGIFGFDIQTLKLIENTFNRYQMRTFKSKSKYTFVTDFEKI